MYFPSAPQSLISYRDVRTNGLHLSTKILDRQESLVFVQNNKVVETAFAAASGLYRLAISPLVVSSFALFCKDNGVSLWHGRLGHSSSILFRKIIPYIVGHNLQPGDTNSMALCQACVQGKLIAKPSVWILPHKLPPMLSRLHDDICGPINPMSGPFQYFFILVDALGRQSQVSLLLARNLTFVNLLTLLIRFKVYFLDYPIKTLRIDNVQEFRLRSFEDYCTATEIELTYSVPYEYAQNRLTKSFIKRIQLITRPLLLHANLLSFMCGYTVLHVATLIRFRPSFLKIVSSQKLLSSRVPNVFHLRVFGCRVWVPISEPQCYTGTH